ncbi:hypothetical protein [Treponema sp. R6D11]
MAKFRKSLFGYNKKQVFKYITETDAKIAELLDSKEKEIESLKAIEDIVTEDIAKALEPVAHPIYIQTEEDIARKKRELEVVMAELAGLKKKAKEVIEGLDKGFEELEIGE